MSRVRPRVAIKANAGLLQHEKQVLMFEPASVS